MLYPLLWLLSCFTAGNDSLPAYYSLPEEKIVKKIVPEARSFCKKNAYDTTVCFLIDLSIHNGRKRFFTCDLLNNKIINSGLVTHGSCNTRYLSQVQYSNKAGCGCSSYGKYKVGSFYKGAFGDAYKLYGLDSSNSNAYNRYIVLHSHSCVPDTEIFPNQICNSQGCTTVSPAFLKELETIIAKKKQPILLWVLR
ncbi:MAG: murein L,D-transpeptidase catalytic domain-containing protein [Sediminibacterium sp.]